MELVKDSFLLFLNAFITFIIVLGNFYLALRARKRLLETVDSKYAVYVWLLLVQHIIFTILFYLLTKVSKADAVLYYEEALNAKSWFSLFELGTDFIKFIVYPFVKLGVSYFNLFFVFSTIGILGFYRLFFMFVEELKDYKIKFKYLVFFLLPTFHFYTSAIGKDSLIFFLLVALFYQIKRNSKFNINYILPFLFIFLIRPHVAVFIAAAYIIVQLWDTNVRLLKKLGILTAAFIGLIIFLPTIEKKLDVDFSSTESISRRINKIQYYSKRQGESSSAIDIRDNSIPFRMFAYSYLPLIWKADNVIKYIVSIENLYLIIMFITFLFKKGKIRFLSNSSIYLRIFFMYSIITWFISSFTLYNLGLSTRQKYMYIPFLYFVIMVFFTASKKKLRDAEA